MINILIMSLLLWIGAADDTYIQGKKALNERQWDAAIEHFEAVIARNAPRTDAAMYWKAYALYKVNRHKEAVLALNTLMRDFPESPWIGDARALVLEMRQDTGQVVDPEGFDDPELKIMALSGLMTADATRAFPIIKRLLESDQPLEVKKKALLVAAQHESRESVELIARAAQSDADPELRDHAIHLLGLFGDNQSLAMLRDLYLKSRDSRMKRRILDAFIVSSDPSGLVSLLDEETEPELRVQIIQALGVGDEAEYLKTLFETLTEVSEKKAVLRALFLADAHQTLFDIAEREEDPNILKSAIENLGLSGECDSLKRFLDEKEDPDIQEAAINAMFLADGCPALEAFALDAADSELRELAIEKLGLSGRQYGPTLIRIYHSTESTNTKQAVLKALFLQDNDKAIIGLAQEETDPELKKVALRTLSLMGNETTLELFRESD